MTIRFDTLGRPKTCAFLLGSSCFAAALLACSSDPAETSSSGGQTSTTAGLPTSTGTTAGTGGNTATTAGTGTSAGTGTGTTGGQTTGGQTTGSATGTTGVSTGTGTATTGVGTGTTGVGGGSATSSTTGAVGDCGITIDSQETSEEIPTVGIVTWSATSPIDSAEIQFGPSGGGMTMSAPVDLNEQGYRTLLIGMKEVSDYDFQVVAQSGGTACASDVQTITTGPVSNVVPTINMSGMGGITSGFFVTVGYGNSAPAFIFDADGDPVWWTGAPPNSSRARMDWDAKNMWIVTGNPFSNTTMGQIRRVSMDGLTVDNVPNTGGAHHDLAPLPDGSVVATLHQQSGCSSIVKITPDLQVTPIIPNVDQIYTPVMDCHPNSILYHDADQTLTISDRNPNMYVKVTLDGSVVWQFGGSNPKGDHIQGSWQVNHGHHVLENGNFLFFNNNGPNGGQTSYVLEYALDTTGMTAQEVFSYSGGFSTSLGDVQRLPNGNTLVTVSNQSVIREVTPDSQVARTIEIGVPLGYTMWRETLYGPPPK